MSDDSLYGISPAQYTIADLRRLNAMPADERRQGLRMFWPLMVAIEQHCLGEDSSGGESHSLSV